MKTLIALLLTFSIYSFADAPSRCTGGGDGGGVPLSVIPTTSEAMAHFVPTKFLFLDFILWEKANQVLYVDDKTDLRTHSLGGGTEEKITKVGFSRFSKNVDLDNRFVVDADFKSIYDLKEKKIQTPAYPKPQMGIFWNEGVLYTVPKPTNSEPYLSVIYAYDAIKNTLSSCTIMTMGKRLSPASQSSFPYLQAFRSEKKGDGSYVVNRYPIDVRGAFGGYHCRIVKEHGYLDNFPGPVKKLYYYESLDANVFELDHPTKNLLWDRGAEECVYYNLQAKQSSVLLGQVPLVATWGGNGGVELLYPRSQKKIQLPSLWVGKFPLTLDSFALSENGKKLYVSQRPEENAGDNKILLKFDLREMHQ